MSRLLLPVLLLAATPFLFGQGALDRLVAESVRLRGIDPASPDPDKPDSSPRDRWTNQKNALRDWMESRLPANITELDATFSNLEAQLVTELDRAGLSEPENLEVGFGYVSRLKFSRPTEYPGALVVQAGISVECGIEDSVYVYRFAGNTRKRLLEANGTAKYAEHVVDTRFSPPDASGSRIFYAAWSAVQCYRFDQPVRE